MAENLRYIWEALSHCDSVTFYISKWSGILDLSSLQDYLTSMQVNPPQSHIDSLLSFVEENHHWYAQKLAKRKEFKRWRKRRRRKEKDERYGLFRKLLTLFRSQQPKELVSTVQCAVPEPANQSKVSNVIRKIQAAIECVEGGNKDRAEELRRQLEALLAENKRASEETEAEKEPMDLGFVLDYYRLLSDPLYLQSRQTQWCQLLPS